MTNTNRAALENALTRTDLSQSARYDIRKALKSDASATVWVRGLRAAGVL